MEPDPNPEIEAAAQSPTLADDEQRLAELAAALVDAVDAEAGPWVQRCVLRVASAAGVAVDVDLELAAARGAAAATSEVTEQLRSLLAIDVDQQRTNPLSVLRAAVRHPTEVLRSAGVPPVPRDDFTVERFPEDLYDLSPAAFADVSPALHEPGLMWGAAKAHVHLRRRREGLSGNP